MEAGATVMPTRSFAAIIAPIRRTIGWQSMNLFGYLRHALLALFVVHEFPVLFGLILVEEVGLPLPLPGDTLIAYAGSLPGRSPLSAVAVIAVVALAAALGSSLLYLLARRGGPRVVARLQRLLHLRPERIARMQASFLRRGALAIVVGRLIPGLRTPTSVMAGLSGVPYRVFMPSTTVAAIIWAAFYYFAGSALGRLWAPLTDWVGEETEQVASVAVFVIALVAVWLWLRHTAGRGKPSGEAARVPSVMPQPVTHTVESPTDAGSTSPVAASVSATLVLPEDATIPGRR